MKRARLLVVLSLMFGVPMLASAATLSSSQIDAILGLLRAFNASETLVASVALALAPSPVASTTPPVHHDTTGSPYHPSNLGFDLSFATHNYPDSSFGFVVVGLTAGKDFVYNQRARSEYNFAQFGSSPPTVYLNLNAPYGSTATAAHMESPRSCDALFGAATTSKSAGGTYPEPTVCGSYNYGYNAAKGAYEYGTSVSVTSSFWWLDVEEDNSWSGDVAVNDAVIQGAIDFLNTRGIRVGVYSTTAMWRRIAGAGFSPTQTIAGVPTSTPTWFPIGIASQIEATNACLHESKLIPGSPVWIIQYEASSTAVDQNIAC